MGNFAVHIAVGAVAAAATGGVMFGLREHLPAVEPVVKTIPTVCGAMVFGSIYPDTDIKSKSSYICNFILIAVCAVSFYFFKQYYISGLAAGMVIVALFTPHRGPCHRLWFNLLVAVLIGVLFNPYPAIGYFIGVMAHLVSDGR